MPLTPPATLSPSKVSAFTDCALAFRFSAIDGCRSRPRSRPPRARWCTAALERLFALPRRERTRGGRGSCLDEAGAEIRADPDFTGLALDEAAEAAFFAEAGVLLDHYFDLEDPTTINPIGLELMLEVAVGGVALRGIIDRLELDADGELVVTDYKTGRAPGRAPGAAPPRRACSSTPSCASSSSAGARPGCSCCTSATQWPSSPCPPEQSTAGTAHQGRGHLAGRREGVRGATTSGPAPARCATGAASSPTARHTAATRPPRRPRR